MRKILLWLPLGLFAVFLITVALGLINPTNRVIESRMIGKAIPEFVLPAAVETNAALSIEDLRTGKPKLLNVFASWCVPCIAEAPYLEQLKNGGAEIHAIAIRDRSTDVAKFLSRWGNPYAKIGSDKTSSVQLELGSSGVPETFVVNGEGLITYQHIGDIRAPDVPLILAALEAAK